MLLDVSVMTFDRPEAWQWLVQFCILATALLLGNVQRTKIPFLNKSLLPSALLGGLLLLVMGIMGIYIGKIYDQVKGRQLFIVKDKVNL